jgi:hypothetical protein
MLGRRLNDYQVNQLDALRLVIVFAKEKAAKTTPTYTPVIKATWTPLCQAIGVSDSGNLWGQVFHFALLIT